jgi:hypothetical protein
MVSRYGRSPKTACGGVALRTAVVARTDRARGHWDLLDAHRHGRDREPLTPGRTGPLMPQRYAVSKPTIDMGS